MNVVPAQPRERGFTLLELLVVLVVIGIMLGVVSVNALQTNRQKLLTDAQRISLLLQVVREEAIVRNRPTAFEANATSYRFLVKNENRWEEIRDLDMLREREFTFFPTRLSLSNNTQLDGNSLRILFGREPVDRPFVLELVYGEERAVIRADGIGHFVAE